MLKEIEKETSTFLVNVQTEDNHFLIVDDNIQNIFNEITHIPNKSDCEIVRLKNQEEANSLAFQKYNHSFDSMPSAIVERMPIPVNGNFYICANEPTPSNDENDPSLNINGVWSLTAINGFGTKADLKDTLKLMSSKSLIYPIAKWHPDEDEAIRYARSNYVTRFYQRYDGKTIAPSLPDRILPLNEFFISPHHKKFEEDRIENPILQKLLEFGLLNA